MMPLFFHIEAHLWVIYCLFANGVLLSLLAKRYSAQVNQLFTSLESILVSGLFVSLLINGSLFYLLSRLAVATSSAQGLLLGGLLIVTVVSSVMLLLSGSNARGKYQEWRWEDTRGGLTGRLLVYVSIAIVLFYNGALLEQVSDAWWHLSLANTLSNDVGLGGMQSHLLGSGDRVYPPLWHMNLAVIKLLSSQALPELFNAATPWLAVTKLMAVYLFVVALTGSRNTALISLILYIVLPGLAGSYLRVSAWPSHISYTAWFFAFFAIFNVLDGLARRQVNETNRLRASWHSLKSSLASGLALLLALTVIFYTHRVELVWLFVALSTYLLVVSASAKASMIEPSWQAWYRWVSIAVVLCLLAGLIYLSSNLWFESPDFTNIRWDSVLVYGLPPFILLITLGLVASVQVSSGVQFRRILCVLLAIVVALIVDWRHFASAFYPDLAYPARQSLEWPLSSLGWFGSHLLVPGWHLQLRSGLVPLGVLSIPMAFVLAVYRPCRATWFLAACGCIALLICVSPYLYTWFTEALNYHSVWRVSILIFQPVVFALTLAYLWQACQPWSKLSLLPATGLLLLGVILGIQSVFHLDPQTTLDKRAHGSAQRHWNIHYGQNYIFYDGSFRYSEDFKSMASLIDNNAVILSDLATSYYASAYLRGDVVNVHRHQGRMKNHQWREYLRLDGLCGAVDSASIEKLLNSLSKQAEQGKVFYLLNVDRLNRNVRASCESNREHIIRPFVEKHARVVFKGQYLELYDFSGLAP